MKNKAIILAIFLLAFNGILIGSGQVYAKAQDNDKIVARVIENCGLDENWTAYMAVYGHVNGDYLYFYRSLSTDMRSVYRIGLKDYKLEKYISNIWTPKFIDNYIFYNTGDYILYAKDLDTGRTIKLADDGSCRDVRKYKNYIYFIDASENKLCVFVSKRLFGLFYIFCKKRIDSEVNHYDDDEDKGLVMYKDRLYYAKYVKSPEGFITGVKVYSCRLNGTDKKPVDTELPSDGVLFLRNGDLLFGYRDDAIEESENLYTYNALYRFDGKTFVNIGATADYPQYDDRLSDGYHYMIGKLENGKPIDAEEGQLKVLRKDQDGKWTVFANTPFEVRASGIDFVMQTGCLMLLCDHGFGVTDEIIIYDKNGNLMVDVPIAGETDESYMEAKIVGEYVYIIHGEYAFDKITYRTIDKCEIIKLTD
ncbi:MAG: hypothetical protein IJL55_11185 [Lachnospiraceae bacterium]|nr:hypothetical protein [Lachnospiraceae bacterium]